MLVSLLLATPTLLINHTAQEEREGVAEEVAIPDPAVGAGESAAVDPSEVQIGVADTMVLGAKTATEVTPTVPDVDMKWNGAPTLCIQSRALSIFCTSLCESSAMLTPRTSYAPLGC